MKNCPRTTTGEHEFKEAPDAKDLLGLYLEKPICRFCGMINTQKEE